MKRRASGLLLHITSLPSPHGIGDFGPQAYRFADFLAESGQGYWQVLPLTPTSTDQGNSPYSSDSAFGGNTLLISPELLLKQGILDRGDLKDRPAFSDIRVDYPKVTRYKRRLLERAFRRQKERLSSDPGFQVFCLEQRDWLEDHALFAAIKEQFHGRLWSDWPSDLRDRKEKALNAWRSRLRDPILREKYAQYLFFSQWSALKAYCGRKCIQTIGDLPIYVHGHSTDVWTHPEIFLLDRKKKQIAVAGIPPDYFSATGQRWGNPIYRWDVLKDRGYDWWVQRIAHNLRLFDIVRLDHFKGFIDFWEVPAREKTAVHGRWVKGPGAEFFTALLRHFPCLPFIAEDLGVITAELNALRDRFELPGMRILQFAFGNDPLAEIYKPMNYIPHCVAYTGTHDNDTLISLLFGKGNHSTRSAEEIRIERENAFRYLGTPAKRTRNVHWEFIRLLMMSAANLVIFPMQDILGLGEEGRMNRPATAAGNWEWRLGPKASTRATADRLARLSRLYGRT